MFTWFPLKHKESKDMVAGRNILTFLGRLVLASYMVALQL